MSVQPLAKTNPSPSSSLLHGRVALITGGSTGMGLAAARDFAKEGAKVFLVARRKEKLEDAVREINHTYGKDTAACCTGDMSKESDNKEMVERCIQTFGAVHVVFLNAGIYRGGVNVCDMQEEMIDNIFNTNFKSVVWGLKYCCPAVDKTAGGKGSVIINASIGAKMWRKPGGGSIYKCSKAAVNCLMKTAAVEQRGKMRINAIEPGMILTEIGGNASEEKRREAAVGAHLVDRIGEPEEVAAVVTFLASDKASFITGAEIDVDAGMQLR